MTKPDGLSSEFIRFGTGVTEWERLEAGLRSVTILEQTESMTAFADVEPWHRGGAETYLADAIVESDRRSRHVIGKALVPFGTLPEVKLSDWIRRRTLLEKLKIRVSHLYSTRDATIFEDYIDFDLSDALFSDAIFDQIGRIGARLDFNGFYTLSFLDDLRIKDGLVYYVDFGFDLGEPSSSRKDSARQTIASRLGADGIDRCLLAYDDETQQLDLLR